MLLRLSHPQFWLGGRSYSDHHVFVRSYVWGWKLKLPLGLPPHNSHRSELRLETVAAAVFQVWQGSDDVIIYNPPPLGAMFGVSDTSP